MTPLDTALQYIRSSDHVNTSTGFRDNLPDRRAIVELLREVGATSPVHDQFLRSLALYKQQLQSAPNNDYAERYRAKSEDDIAENKNRAPSTWAIWVGWSTVPIGEEIYNECSIAYGHGASSRLLELVDEWFANDVLNWANAAKHAQTPLHQACEVGNVEAVKLLVAAPGIDVNRVTAHEETPLTICAKQNRVDCARLLLGSSNLRDVQKSVSDALRIAKRSSSNREITALLLAALGASDWD